MRLLVVSCLLLILASCATEPEDLAATPRPAEPQPDALKEGLSARYLFQSLNSVPDLRGWLRHRDPEEGPPLETLTHYMDRGPVLTSGKVDFVGAYITGYLKLESAGQYRFQVTNNDGVRIHLGGALLYDDPRTGPDRTSDPILLEISAPGWYALEIWYFEKRGTATLDLLWSPPGSEGFGPLPPESLAHS